jgi:hypothetical protein
MAAQLPNVLLAGWGVKLPLRQASIFKTWKRRYFVLREATAPEVGLHGCSHLLLYFKTVAQLKTG